MKFNIEFHLQNEISFSFDNNECDMVDLLDGEPLLVYATISLGDETKIGALSGYLLYNDMDFFTNVMRYQVIVKLLRVRYVKKMAL